MKRNWLIFILFLLVFGILLSLYFVFWNEPKMKLTEKIEVPVQTPKEITKVVEESRNIDQFIMSKLPSGEYITHSHEETEATNNELREETVQFIYSAFMLQDIDQLTVAFSSNSIRSLQNSTETGVENNLIQEITYFLQLVNRNGKLDKLEYQFELDKYNQETNKGVITILYTDNQQIKVEIEVAEIGDEDHRAYEVITPLSDMKQIIQSIE